jgi:hypothetical protein
MEAVMSRVITFDKGSKSRFKKGGKRRLRIGSKRRLKQIRWKLFEIFSLALLAGLLFGVSILVMLSELDHEHPHSEPTKVPQIRNAEPAEP